MMQAVDKRWCTATLSLLIVSAVAAVALPASFELGQRWTYEHQGPRPGSTEPNAVDGQRILQVVAAGAEPGNWVLRERYTGEPNVVGRLFVREQAGLLGFEVLHGQGEVLKMTYDTPMPYPVPQLEVGQETTVENVLRVDSPEFVMPIKVVTQRLEDETVTTPAGQFVDCQHYRTITGSTINVKVAKVPVSEQRDRWYHESVHGLVKEVYRKEPVKFLAWSQEGYTATSVLTAFGREAVEPVAEPAPQSEANDPPAPVAQEPSAVIPPSTPHVGGFPVWLPAAVVAVFGVAIVILIRRPRHK